jgi:hypothetical protein
VSHFSASIDEAKWDIDMADAAILLPEFIPALLADMDLTMEGLRAAVWYADAERAMVSKNDTPGLDQALMYHKVGRGLRDTFCGEHWEIDNSDNHTAIKHTTKPVRIVPCNFDENTGNLLIQPTNRTDKGAVMARRTKCNATGSLFGADDLPVKARDGRITWLLGTFSNGDGAPRAELSLPVAFTDKHITELEKRIIVLDGTEHLPGARDSEQPVEVVDIKIVPR